MFILYVAVKPLSQVHICYVREVFTIGE